MPPTLHHAITTLISHASLALTTETERHSKRGNGNRNGNGNGNGNGKGGTKQTDGSDPGTTSDTTGDPTGLLGTIGGILTANPILIPILLIAALIGINIGWRRLTAHQNERGRPLRPLGAITKDTIKFALREDTRPLHSKIPYLTGRRTYLALTLTGVLSVLYPGHHLGIAWIALPALIYARAAKVFKARQAVIRQMFDVAHGECKYDKNAFLAPWTRINVQNWENLTSPGLTVVTIPAAYQSEDLKTREKFERQFNGTISEANSWTYTWESAKNRIVCKPASFLPTMAPYPGPNEKWDTIDLGIKMDGTVASYSVSEFPHSLICGPTGSGKQLELSTIVPTPTGWTTIGEVAEGDWLFDRNGNPTRVVGLSPIETPEKAYEVVFSDGSTVTCDPDHLWWTETRSVRESRWTEKRKPRSRKPLLSVEVRERLLEVAAEAKDDHEIAVPTVAELAGVSPSTGWLNDLAAEVGQVAEAQVMVEHHYEAQQVTQTQSVRLYPARMALKALAEYRGKVVPWVESCAEAARRAADASPGSLVSSREIAEVLGIRPTGRVGSALAQAGLVVNKTYEVGQRGPTSWAEAVSGWSHFARTGEPSWAHLREKLLEMAAETPDGDEVTLTDLFAIVGVPRARLAVVLESMGVAARISREPVTLSVMEKTVSKPSPWVRLYPAKRLLEEVAAWGARSPYDQRFKQARGAVRTTEEIRASLRTSHGHANHSVPVAHALMAPEADLPVAPYTFGAWLGDGTSWQAEITGIDHQVAREIEADGYRVTARKPAPSEGRHHDYRTWTVHGIRKHLRDIGVLKTSTEQGHTKFIPPGYLRASREQRQALLAGLMDTDGTVGPSGSVSITQVNERLARDVRELACSLGYRATLREGRARLNGVDMGAKWTVSWTSRECPFRLDRKRAAHADRTAGLVEERSAYRYIVDVREVPPVPMRCVMVESADRVFLVGESMIPTHNSVLQRMVLFHCLSHSDTWKIVGVDPKMVEMSWLKKYDNVLQIALTLEESIEVITQVRDEMKRRYEEMSETGVVHFKKLASPPPALMLMVDETFNLLAPEGVRSDEGKERDALHAQGSTLLGEIARLGRAAGVYLVLATQRPDATVIKGEMKNNLDCRIAAGKMDNTPSLMVLDSEAATRLPKIKGRGMLRTGGDLDTFQGFFAEQSWFDEQLAARAAAEGATGEVLDDGPAMLPSDEDTKAVEGKARGRRGLLAALTAKAEQRAAAMDVPADAADGSATGVADTDDAPESWVGGEPAAVEGTATQVAHQTGAEAGAEAVAGSKEDSAGEGLSISGEFGGVDGLDDLGELDGLGSFEDFGDLGGLDDLDGLGDLGDLGGLDDLGNLDQLGEMRAPGEPGPLVEPLERTQEDSPAVDSGASVAGKEPAQGDSPPTGSTSTPPDVPAPVVAQPVTNRPRLPSVAAVPAHGTGASAAPSAAPRRRLGAPVTTSTPIPATAPSPPSPAGPAPSTPPSPMPPASPVTRPGGDDEGSTGGPATGQGEAVDQPSGSRRLPTSPPPRRLPTAPPPRT